MKIRTNEILQTIKDLGGRQTVTSLAQYLNLTTSRIRYHLKKLYQQHLIAFEINSFDDGVRLITVTPIGWEQEQLD